MDKLRGELLALGYGRTEVDSLLEEIGKRRNTKQLSPLQKKMLFVTLQEMLEMSRAAKYRERRVK